MKLAELLEAVFQNIAQSEAGAAALVRRIRSEINFAQRFVELYPEQKAHWEKLVLRAAKLVQDRLSAGGAVDLAAVVAEAEEIMSPIGQVAKEYTIHCCGHAHIDMNWMWSWPETVGVSRDTFATVDKLMDEFPDFHFSQSQASTYIAMQKYHPEIFEAIKRRVKEGRWEVTASMWVEGDKNMVSGESLCRHLLYTRQYFKECMGLEPEDVKMDWSPDTFGHAHTLPSILTRGGVSRYYHVRTGPDPWLYKWRSPEGREVLAFNDKDRHGYNGPIYPEIVEGMIQFAKQTGLKDFLCMYGVGDHGGGPTRRDLRLASEIATWPTFPVLKLSTTDAFFSAVEEANPDLPVVDKDLNFIFEGCYTSQSNIKYANRVSEIALPEAEALAVIAGAAVGMDYPGDLLRRAWRWTLFNHFHDIFPGSGVKATYEYAQGLFQEIQATTDSIRTRALRGLAAKVNTASAALTRPSAIGSGLGDGLGAGAGDPGVPGGVAAYNAGAPDAEPILVYNQKPWPRSEVVYAKVWNKQVLDDRVIARDSNGKEIKAQVVARGKYWDHDFATVAFKAESVPAVGYKVYAIDNAPGPVHAQGAEIGRMISNIYGICFPNPNGPRIMENEYLKVEIDFPSGAIKHLIDKETGWDCVPEGKLFGLLEVYQESHHGMTAWIIGQTPESAQLTSGGDIQVIQQGPNRVALRVNRKYRDSTISLEIGLNSGSRMLDFKLNTRWVERGTPETGVLMLKVAFPAGVKNGVPTYEIPFGSQVREQSEQEVPALKWADLSGDTAKGKHGITLVNDSKYGHSCVDDTLRLTLIRSSYDPDPLPEIRDHEIGFGIIPHKGVCDVVAATRAGESFNSPLAVASATVQKGELPPEKSYVEVLTPNVFVSAIKKAESDGALIIRLVEMAGKETEAQVRITDLVKPGTPAKQVDLLERPLQKAHAKMLGDVLTVKVPAHGIASVMVG
ncbi:MAG TPA: glycoside hydrolase family 38 C-terminal domain-containing protein [Armatimonadota bacterium]|nr:glycoside hydrolase family 38 C-terminal domain-containing protein [Armatimonadota bacterium]